jgi:hypothetical protein
VAPVSVLVAQLESLAVWRWHIFAVCTACLYYYQKTRLTLKMVVHAASR